FFQVPPLGFPQTLLVAGPTRSTLFDFTGDGRADIGVFRPGSGDWLVAGVGPGGTPSAHPGIAGGPPGPADFDGDGKTDVAIYRPATGEWFTLRSSDGLGSFFVLGGPGDVPIPADFDGDGIADYAVFRPATSQWLVRRSSDGVMIVVAWGS